MSKIVLEDFNEGDGYYIVNLAYLSKEQVEEIETLVSKWHPTDEDIKSCIGMCLTDANEQRFKDYGTNLKDCIAWLEKHGEQHSAIRWYDVSLIPQEMEELLVEWDSEDATWHEIAFYHADTKTFWDGTRQVENVTRWCYIDDIIEQSPKPKWTEEDEHHWMMCIECVEECASQEREDFSKTIDWLKSIKQRMEE